MNKFQAIWLLSLVLAIMPCMVQAAPVNARDAQLTAQQFMQSQAAGKLMSHHAAITLAHAEGSSVTPSAIDYYVFNATDGSSFVIVSGDDRAESVLAFGDGTLDMTRVPCNMQSLLDAYKEQLDYLHAHPGMKVQRSAPALMAYSQTCLPLLTCDWSQGKPYNDQCPEQGGERCVTGCVATAMAQVMYFWRYPVSSPAIRPLTLSWITLPQLPGTAFRWDDMIDVYTGDYTPAQGEAVATLMRYCGQASSMDYGVDGSGTQVRCQRDAMRIMGYSSTSMVNRSDYSSSSWLGMMLNELSHGRPILFSGSGSDGGHAFVLDGYDGESEKFHINWGWAARGNGYFALDAFNVEGMAFNSSQQMLINVYPGTAVEPVSQYDFEVDGICYRYADGGDEAEVACRTNAFNSYQGHVAVPAQVTAPSGRTLTVTGIGKSAFRNCTELQSVTLPATIRHIDAYAFRTCSALTLVGLPAGLQTIGDQAFANCVSLNAVYISSSVRKIGYNSFFNCTGLRQVEIDDLQSWIDLPFGGQYSNPLLYAHRLFVVGQEIKHLVLPASLTMVPDYKFMGFSGMTAVTLPDGLTHIGRSAFAQCSSLDHIDFPVALQSIAAQAFEGCTALQHLELTPAVSRIGGMAFADCSALKSVAFTVPGVAIGTDAFVGCTALERVDVPDLGVWLGIGFTSVNSNPLRYACHLYADGHELTDLVIPDSITAIGSYAFYNFTAMNSVTMGSRLTAIGTSAFSLCKGLKDVVIPDAVTTIGEKAFSTCTAMQSLTVGASVTAIGDRAFFACTGLKQVTCRPISPPVARDLIWFSGTTCAQSTLMVPAAALGDYRHAGEWKRFDNIVGIELHDLPGDVNGDGEVTIADVNTLIGMILSGRSLKGAVDVNGDGEISLADVNALIALILK